MKTNKDINIDNAIKLANVDEVILKRRSNKMLLSDFQVDVLNRNGIDYLKYSSVKSLLFEIEECLNEEFDEELEMVSSQIGEFIYYNEYKK